MTPSLNLDFNLYSNLFQSDVSRESCLWTNRVTSASVVSITILTEIIKPMSKHTRFRTVGTVSNFQASIFSRNNIFIGFIIYSHVIAGIGIFVVLKIMTSFRLSTGCLTVIPVLHWNHLQDLQFFVDTFSNLTFWKFLNILVLLLSKLL